MPRALLIAALAAGAACGGEPRPPDLASLAAALARADHDWRVPRDRWAAVVTDAYLGHHDAYAAELARRPPAVPTRAAPRWHYADDPALPPNLVHARWMLAARGAVVDGVDAVFVHDGAAWRAIVDLDPILAPRAEAVAPGCAAAYADLAPRCQHWAWAIADALLRDRPAAARVACERAVALGCGA